MTKVTDIQVVFVGSRASIFLFYHIKIFCVLMRNWQGISCQSNLHVCSVCFVFVLCFFLQFKNQTNFLIHTYNSMQCLSPSHTGLRTSCNQLATEIPATNLRPVVLNLHKIFDCKCLAVGGLTLAVIYHFFESFKAYIRR